jgi:hypothetical protein
MVKESELKLQPVQQPLSTEKPVEDVSGIGRISRPLNQRTQVN